MTGFMRTLVARAQGLRGNSFDARFVLRDELNRDFLIAADGKGDGRVAVVEGGLWRGRQQQAFLVDGVREEEPVGDDRPVGGLVRLSVVPGPADPLERAEPHGRR